MGQATELRRSKKKTCHYHEARPRGAAADTRTPLEALRLAGQEGSEDPVITHFIHDHPVREILLPPLHYTEGNGALRVQASRPNHTAGKMWNQDAPKQEDPELTL